MATAVFPEHESAYCRMAGTHVFVHSRCADLKTFVFSNTRSIPAQATGQDYDSSYQAMEQVENEYGVTHLNTKRPTTRALTY